MYKSIVFTVLCIAFIATIKAQPTATPGSLQTFYEQNNYTGVVYSGIGFKKLNKKFSIACHVFMDSISQDYNITDPEIEAAVIILNQNFAELGFEFEICEINYNRNFQYDAYSYSKHKYEPMVLLSKKNAINLFIATGVVGTGLTAGRAGFASMPSDETPFIYISKPALTNSNSLAHLMGHYFGLYDTGEETAFGPEFVDTDREDCYLGGDQGCRCRTTGDLICDTRADRTFISTSGFFTNTDDQCKFDPALPINNPNATFDIFKDNENEWIEPPMNNFMSGYWGYNADCRDRFSPGQMRKMYLEVTNPNSRIYKENW